MSWVVPSWNRSTRAPEYNDVWHDTLCYTMNKTYTNEFDHWSHLRKSFFNSAVDAQKIRIKHSSLQCRHLEISNMMLPFVIPSSYLRVGVQRLALISTRTHTHTHTHTVWARKKRKRNQNPRSRTHTRARKKNAHTTERAKEKNPRPRARALSPV